MLRHIRLAPSWRTFLLAAPFASAALLAGDAPAANPNWPPPESATSDDLADPATWPDDSSYAYCPSPSPHCEPDENSDGQWNYYSFIPTQMGSLTLRPEETASGMSIDLAWRYTIGDDSVRIAVMDSGIRWSENELIEKAWLNPGELALHKPRHSDGSPCADAGTLVGFDCNGDGVLTVSDYAETPALNPPGDGTIVHGDANGNGHLDAGDLILNFSDGIDDDDNGYLDDISGWDFMKDDNDPYDDTQYGHGTGEARDSTAQGNNGTGEIGGCPLCRFIPVRVGDSFIADVQAFGQGVIYATDNGARVVQSALGTINMTRFAQAALDYAYEHGVLVVASMADENARHHNMPTTANHTLPVHAIQFRPTTRVTNVETFLDFNGCTNFGGQNLLSASGTGCSSEAVGQLSGMSGLLFSAAIKYGFADLTGAEAAQLFINTADDIDVPESREGSLEDRNYYWSQPGFDQRFGYGRVNANTAVEWVKAGKIPPEVDIVRPYWFEVLYRDQLQGPVEIRGSISAKRAISYDYRVEWAPGVQPLDEAFQEVASETNVPPEVITGGDEPIALFDVRTIDTSHEPDPDSPNGENEHTITVRIRALARYGGEIGEVPGEMRRTYYVHSDPDLVKGFPMYVGDSGEASPKMADLDGDGVRDLIYATGGGVIHALKITPSGPVDLPGWPFTSLPLDGLRAMAPLVDKPSYRGAPGYASGDIDPALGADPFLATPAIANLDDDAELEVVATTWNGSIYVIEHDGKVKEGFPLRLPEVPSCPLDGTPPDGPCMGVGDYPFGPVDAVIDRGAFASPVLEDMDGDGKLDIIQAAFDGKVYVFSSDGTPVDGFPVHPHYTGSEFEEPGISRILTTPAVADFNGDGVPDLLVGTNEKLGGNDGQVGAMYLMDGRGTNAPAPIFVNWPVTATSFNLFPLVAEGIPNSGIVGVFDGTLAAVFHGNASAPFILPADPGAQGGVGVVPENGIPTYVDPDTGTSSPGVAPTSYFGKETKADNDVMFPLFSNPSLGDIDQDGVLDVIASGSSLTIAQSLLPGASAVVGQQLVAAWSGKTGAMLPGSPFLLEDYSFFNSHAIVDLNGDDYPEIVAGSGGYFLHAWDGCGREPAGWPKFTGQWIIPTPAVGDLDGDGKLEVAVGTRNGWLYVWRTEGRSDGMIQWESFHHDNRNTGNYEVALEQGDPDRRAAAPMTTAFCTSVLHPPAAAPGLEPDGGCGQCTVGGPARRSGLAALLAAALACALRRRRRA